MKYLSLFTICNIILICFYTNASGNDKLKLHAKINGKDVTLVMDTGSPHSLIIFKPSAKRLGLELKKENSKHVAKFNIKVGSTQHDTKALVIDTPYVTDIDGLLGWSTLKGSLWKVDWKEGSIFSIPSLPKQISNWIDLDLSTKVPIAAFKPDKTKQGFIYIDTGAHSLKLSDKRWQTWKKNNLSSPMTISSGWSPASGGTSIAEMSWVNQYPIGELTIPHTTIERSSFKWPFLEAVIGLDALSRFEVIFNSGMNKIYLKPRSDYEPITKYNRLGVTFAPKTLDSPLAAYVLKDSPGYRQGIRNGDILLKVNQTDMTKWRTDPEITKKQFWDAKAGTKYKLEIKRNGKIHHLQITLEEILPTQRLSRVSK